MTPGTATIGSADTERTSQSTSWAEGKRIYIYRSGTVRISVDVKTEINGRTGYYALYKNGSQISPEQSVSANNYWTTYTFDTDVSAGDYLSFYYRTNTVDGQWRIMYRNFRLGVPPRLTPTGTITTID